MRSLKTYFFTGLAALLPTVVTIYLVVQGFSYLDSLVSPLLERVLARKPPPFAGFAIAIVAVFFVGCLLATLVGRRLYSIAEALLSRMPLIRHIYPYVKQVTDFVLEEKKIEARAVVAVEYPRKGMYSIGLVTGKGIQELANASDQDLVTVFMVSSPAPFTGYVIVVPRREVIRLNISVDEALRFTISGGVVEPKAFRTDAARGP